MGLEPCLGADYQQILEDIMKIVSGNDHVVSGAMLHFLNLSGL